MTRDSLHLLGPGYLAWRGVLDPWVRPTGGRAGLRVPGPESVAAAAQVR